MKVSGKVHFIGQTKVISDKYQSRDLVIKTDDKYPQTIPFQLSQDKVNLADNLRIGDSVEVSINIRGREWKSPTGEVKYFATLDVWSIQYDNANTEAPVTSSPFADEDDDSPF
jgi:hypothetical protein